MERRNNYLIQAAQAKKRFLTYDQNRLIEKLGLEYDEAYLYVTMLRRRYRISRACGDMDVWDGEVWQGGNSYEEVMTLLDLLCDSRENRWISGKWKNMQAFGMQFHRNLLEDARDPVAERFDREPERLHRACARLGAQKIPGGDYGYAVELFDGLKIGVLFWHGDEEFSPRIRYLWDENANMYIRYETMHFAVGMLKEALMKE